MFIEEVLTKMKTIDKLGRETQYLSYHQGHMQFTIYTHRLDDVVKDGL